MYNTNYLINISKLFAKGLNIILPFTPCELHGYFYAPACGPYCTFHMQPLQGCRWKGRGGSCHFVNKDRPIDLPSLEVQSNMFCQKIVKGEKKKSGNVTSVCLMSFDYK